MSSGNTLSLVTSAPVVEAAVKEPGKPLKCRATCASTGLPCQQEALAGSRVCRTHGGSTRQAKKAAQARLDAMMDRAVSRLGELSEQSEHLPTAFAATKQVLDRTLGATSTAKNAGSGLVVQIGIGIAAALKTPPTSVEARVIEPTVQGDGAIDAIDAELTDNDEEQE